MIFFVSAKIHVKNETVLKELNVCTAMFFDKWGVWAYTKKKPSSLIEPFS